MSCCDQNMVKVWKKEAEATRSCPSCGTPVDEDGEAFDQCSYSPLACEECGWRPCDESC